MDNTNLRNGLTAIIGALGNVEVRGSANMCNILGATEIAQALLKAIETRTNDTETEARTLVG